jgi:DNA-binding transcriptional MerR regulator
VTEPAKGRGYASDAMLTIGRLAEYVGVTVRAIRHYHERGLLAEPARDASGYRRYDAQAVVDLIRIKILAEAGVPLARIDELLEAGPEELAASVAQIDGALRGQIAELERRRQRMADLAGGEQGFLAPELVGFLDELRAAGVRASTVQTERDAWILLLARYPERAREWLARKRADLADPEYRRLYRGYDEAIEWDAADPRIEQLADDLVRYVVEHYPSQNDAPDVEIDDPVVIALLTSHFGGGSAPALERLKELADAKLEGHWQQESALAPGSP